jgi:flagellar biosynthetic protein FliO
MKKQIPYLYAITFFLLLAGSALPGGEHPAIGSFDIEKVRQAASGQDGGSDYDTGKAAVKAGKPENMGLIVVRIGAYLMLITAAIVLVAWLMKRFGLVGRSKISGGSMDLLEVLPIGPNRSILMVRIKDAVVVLGQTQQHIMLIDKLEGDRAVELIASSKGGLSVTQFKDVFDGFMGKIRKPV